MRFLCKNIPKEEWSGILFYTVEGTIADPATLKIEIKDILPMDKGSSGYTEYSFDDRVIDYRMNNPQSNFWRLGHIHSHNVMETFFSSTDMSELNDNSAFHNYYLSLITNNYGDFSTRIAFRGNIISPKYTGLDEKGEVYSIGAEIEAEPVLFMYDCEVTTPENEVIVSNDFMEKTFGIIKKKEKEEKEAKIKAMAQAQKPAVNMYDRKGNRIYPTTSYQNSQEKWWEDDTPNFDKSKNLAKALLEDDDEDDEKEMAHVVAMDSFLIYLLALGKVTQSNSIIDDVLLEIGITKEINQLRDYTDEVIKRFNNLYLDYFGAGIEDQNFLEDINVCNQLLEDYIESYPFIKEVCDFLTKEEEKYVKQLTKKK